MSKSLRWQPLRRCWFAVAGALGAASLGCAAAPAGVDGGGASGDALAPDLWVISDVFASDAPTTSLRCQVAPRGIAHPRSAIVVLLDRSASMGRDLAGRPCPAGTGCVSKWDLARHAIADVVASSADSVDWGLMFVGSAFANDATCQQEGTLDVAPGPGTAAAIAAAIASTGPGSARPTTAAVTNAANYFKGPKSNTPTALLLLTDGGPVCGTSPCAADALANEVADCDDANAVEAVRKAHDWYRTPTFVVGLAISGEASDLTLSQMAIRGGFPRPTMPAYYPVSGDGELGDAMATILSANGDCIFDPGLNPLVDRVSGVSANGVPLPPDSFQLVGSNSLQLVGPTCADYLAGTLTNVEILIDCGLIGDQAPSPVHQQ